MSFWVNAFLIGSVAGGLFAQSTSRGPGKGPPKGEKLIPYKPGAPSSAPRIPDFGMEVPVDPEKRRFVLKENDVMGDVLGKGIPVSRMDAKSCVRKETKRLPAGTPIVLTEFKRCGGVVYYLFATERKNNMTVQEWVAGTYLEER